MSAHEPMPRSAWIFPALAMLLFAAASYWGIGFCSAYALAFHTSLGAAGVWVGLSVGTWVYATLLVWRFLLLSGRLKAQDNMRSA